MAQAQSRFIDRASWLLRLPLETPTIPYEDVRSGCTLWLKLFISHRTAERHVSNLLAKLGVERRSELIAAAHREGLAGA